MHARSENNLPGGAGGWRRPADQLGVDAVVATAPGSKGELLDKFKARDMQHAPTPRAILQWAVCMVQPTYTGGSLTWVPGARGPPAASSGLTAISRSVVVWNCNASRKGD